MEPSRELKGSKRLRFQRPNLPFIAVTGEDREKSGCRAVLVPIPEACGGRPRHRPTPACRASLYPLLGDPKGSDELRVMISESGDPGSCP